MTNTTNKLDILEKELEKTNTTMQRNLDKVLQNTEKTNQLAEESQQLEVTAGIFRKSAGEVKRKTCMENCKLWIILLTIILIIVIIIIIIVFTGGEEE